MACAIGGAVSAYIPIPELADCLVRFVIHFNKTLVKDLFGIEDEEDNAGMYISVRNHRPDSDVVKSLHVCFLHLRIRSQFTLATMCWKLSNPASSGLLMMDQGQPASLRMCMLGTALS